MAVTARRALRPHRRRPFARVAALVAVLVLGACSTRDPLNPLDPDNPDTGGAPRWLSALGDDAAVDLTWDVPSYDDLAGVRLVDLDDGEALFTGGAGPGRLRVSGLANGVARRYRLELDLAGGRTLELPEETATPGRAVPFAVDAVSGTLVRLTPDGREVRWRTSGLDVTSVRVDPVTARALAVEFFTGRLDLIDRNGARLWTNHELAGPLIALHTSDGWWVTDASAGAVALVDDGGAVAYADSSFDLPTGLAEAGPRTVWVADRSGFVARLELDGGVIGDPVALGEPAVLAPAGDGGVWVGDRAEEAAVRLDAGGAELFRVEGLSGIQSMAADPAAPGGVWLVERGAGRLVRIDAAGAETTVVTGLPAPSHLVVSPDGGTIWVADPSLGAVVQYDRSGAELGRSLGLTAPTSVAVAFAPSSSGP